MEEDTTQNKSNINLNINPNNNNNDNQSSYGLLDKLMMMKEHQASPEMIVKYNSIALIKTSNDSEICRLCSLLTSSSPSSTPIGLKLFMKTILVSEKTILSLKIYEYNYLLSKKFKYLKTEAINSSMTLLILINIYDKKCFNNLKDIIEELGIRNAMNTNANNSNANINYQNALSTGKSNQPYQQMNNKSIVIGLMKTTNNFLMKITERQNVMNAKKEIEDMLIGVNKVRIVEIDIDEIINTNHCLIDLIK